MSGIHNSRLALVAALAATIFVSPKAVLAQGITRSNAPLGFSINEASRRLDDCEFRPFSSESWVYESGQRIQVAPDDILGTTYRGFDLDTLYKYEPSIPTIGSLPVNPVWFEQTPLESHLEYYDIECERTYYHAFTYEEKILAIESQRMTVNGSFETVFEELVDSLSLPFRKHRGRERWDPGAPRCAFYRATGYSGLCRPRSLETRIAAHAGDRILTVLTVTKDPRANGEDTELASVRVGYVLWPGYKEFVERIDEADLREQLERRHQDERQKTKIESMIE